MSLLGPEGLERVASASHSNTNALVEKLALIKGVAPVFNRPVFHEAALRLEGKVADILSTLEAQGVLGGFDLSAHYPELGQALLVCATETRNDADIVRYAQQLESILHPRVSGAVRSTA
jgi:glycine dehydrogenase subunit 1